MDAMEGLPGDEPGGVISIGADGSVQVGRADGWECCSILWRGRSALSGVGWVLRLGGLRRRASASCVGVGALLCFRRFVGVMEKSTPGARTRFGVGVRLLRRRRGPMEAGRAGP